jgi:hypothetical protein
MSTTHRDYRMPRHEQWDPIEAWTKKHPELARELQGQFVAVTQDLVLLSHEADHKTLTVWLREHPHRGQAFVRRLDEDGEVFRWEDDEQVPLTNKVRNERVELWAHCVSEHAVILPPDTPLPDLTRYHDDEHEGPGTIRNHDPASRTWSLKKLGEVLSEAEQ